jgi:7-cyano-7-deazaguanine reductase
MTSHTNPTPDHSQLGKISRYADQYDTHLLFPISRAQKRAELGVGEQPVFFGADLWTAYEVSWLNSKGKPQVALAHFVLPADSPNIIESKSFKLYLNSFNNTQLKGSDHGVQAMIEHRWRAC